MYLFIFGCPKKFHRRFFSKIPHKMIGKSLSSPKPDVGFWTEMAVTHDLPYGISAYILSRTNLEAVGVQDTPGDEAGDARHLLDAVVVLVLKDQ